MFKRAVRRDYLHVLDSLRAIARKSNRADSDTPAIEIWQGFASAVKLNEADLRSQVAAERKQVVSGRADGGAAVPVGCNWYKCMMYDREDDGITLFRCAGCDTAMYCGSVCQTR